MAKQHFLMIRATPAEKLLAQRVADRSGVTLSALIRRYIRNLAARQDREQHRKNSDET